MIEIIFVSLVSYFVLWQIANLMLGYLGLEYFKNIKQNNIDTYFGEWYCKRHNMPTLRQLQGIQHTIKQELKLQYLDIEYKNKIIGIDHEIFKIIYASELTIQHYINWIDYIENTFGCKLRGKK